MAVQMSVQQLRDTSRRFGLDAEAFVVRFRRPAWLRILQEESRLDEQLRWRKGAS